MDETKTERSIRILLHLMGLGGRPITVNNVMAFLGAPESERRGVQRDLRLLSEIPDTGLVSEGTGRDLKYRISKKNPESRPLRANDLFAFLLFARIQQKNLHGGAEGMRVFEEIVSKVVTSMSGLLGGKDPYRDLTARFGDLVWFAGEEIVAGPDADLVPTLFQGLLERRKIQVEYGGWADEKQQKRVLEPWKLVVFRGELYFLSPRHNEPEKLLTYKLTRIRKATLLNETFVINPKVMKRYSEKHKTNAGLLGNEVPKPTRIRLAFGWDFRHILQERKVHPTQKVTLKDVEDKENRWVLVTMEAPVDEDLMEWVRKWGTGVEVIGPAEMKRNLLAYAVYVKEMYDE